MKVYIAGPMTGIPDMNRAAFAQRAKELIALGHDPLNPLDIKPDHGGVPCCGGISAEASTTHEYGCFLRADIVGMLQHCEAISLLDGWEASRGASAEEHVARAVGLKVIEV